MGDGDVEVFFIVFEVEWIEVCVYVFFWSVWFVVYVYDYDVVFVVLDVFEVVYEELFGGGLEVIVCECVGEVLVVFVVCLDEVFDEFGLFLVEGDYVYVWCGFFGE